MSVQVNEPAKQERILQILMQPHLSEKSTIIAEKKRQYVFKVASDAVKNEIKQAVEFFFNVSVRSVRVCNMKGKSRIFKQRIGHRKGWKKAYVA